MDYLKMFRYVDLLANKYLDKSFYGHDKEKNLLYLGIADRLIKLSQSYLDVYYG